MVADGEKALKAANKLWRNGIPAALVLVLIAGTIWLTKIAYTQQSNTSKIKKLDKSVEGINSSIKEIREGTTPYQQRMERQRSKDLNSIRSLIKNRFPRRRDSRPYE